MCSFKLNSALFVILAVLAVFIYTTCETPMGMGTPIDTTSPIVTITTPKDGQYIRNLEIGESFDMTGTWSDDMGVTELRFMDMFRGEERGVFDRSLGNLEYTINSDGTWSAKIFVAEEGTYRLRVTAYDSFGNNGVCIVEIQVYLRAPWIDEILIKRHPRVSPPIYAALRNRAYYEGLNYLAPGFHREIQLENLDEFQNEQFTVALKVNDNINVAGSRLNVYDGTVEEGIRLNAEPLIPARIANNSVKEPEWDITKEMMEGWNSKFERGPHYISFEVQAWNEAYWEGDWQTGAPVYGGTYLEAGVNGTCWYPESDAPHILVFIPTRAPGATEISLPPNSQNSLILEVFEDDRLSEIYSGLITREKMDELRGALSEEEYIYSLETDAERRQVLLNELPDPQNRFVPGSSPDNRSQQIPMNSGATGEYRLIAFAKDAKYETNPELDTFNTPRWGTHVPLRVFVVNPDAPIIIVENPATENIFPTLTDGRKFTITGYTIDRLGTDWVQIAWVPASITNGQAAGEAALRAANLNYGQSTVTANQIKVWKLPRGERTVLALNNNDYMKDTFSQQFDIINDFQFNGAVENQNKLFVIYTSNGGSTDVKAFVLTDYKEKPAIETLYPWRDLMVHDTKSDLTLSMRVSSAIGIAEGGIIIDDTTAGTPNLSGFTGPVTFDAASGEYRRFVPSTHILANFPEGSRRIYRFSARDILGNTTEVNRNVTMSNIPVLMYVRSTNTSDILPNDRANATATTFADGDPLTFEAVFSLPIRIIKGPNGGPRLKLFFNDHPAFGSHETQEPPPSVYATYIEGTTETTMLSFTYTVQAGDYSAHLHSSLNPIDLNGATIENAESAGGEVRVQFAPNATNAKLQDRSFIGLDGVHPVISKVMFGQPISTTNQRHYNNGKTVTLELTTNKQVRISGSPTALLDYTDNSLTTTNRLEASYTRVGHNSNGTSTIYFDYIVNVADGLEKQLRWAGWKPFTASDAITDIVGTAGNALVMESRPADVTGSENSNAGVAYIDTKPPDIPSFTLHRTQANITTDIIEGDVKFNNDIYIRVDREPYANLYFSTENGNNPRVINGPTADNLFGTISDANRGNNTSNTYVPSEYIVTAWQEDRAGNRSDNAPSRNVTINSRAPELVGISCAQPDGHYTTGANLEFRLTFERAVTVAGTGSTLNLAGIATGYTDTQTLAVTQGTSSTVLSYNWTVASGKRMRNIKLQSVTFPNVTDEYGNTLKGYSNTVTVENATWRPINNNSGYNLTRPDLIVDSTGPTILTYNPTAPRNANTEQNGGVLSGTTITLTFDKPVFANANKNITIRPWNKWAVPPILSADDMDSLYNSSFPEMANIPNDTSKSATEYQKRLKWVDGSGLPEYTPGGNKATMLAERLKYNYYTFTTHGIKNVGEYARPDTSSKYVLAFRHDLYDGVQELRNVFNAARWKWQIISASSVTINANTVTINLAALDPGRIWEVIIDAGAFRDSAGNEFTGIAATNTAGQGYRFWSASTAAPVIRVDRYSQGDNYHGIFDAEYNWFDAFGSNNLPKIDTRVRIDCETPGASINYGVYRTSYTPKAAVDLQDNGGFFSATGTAYDNAVEFFDHYNVNGDVGNTQASFNVLGHNGNLYANNYTNKGFNYGYANNLIGNGGTHQEMIWWGEDQYQWPIPYDTNGYFAGLLVPNKVDNSNSDLGNNGAIAMVTLTGISPGRTYKSVSSTGVVEKSAPVFTGVSGGANDGKLGNGYFFYAGDAFKDTGNGALTDHNATNLTDSRLYSGRRDYVIASARKNAVDTNNTANNNVGAVPAWTATENWSGPQLGPSVNAYEGVYKTTLLYRKPWGIPNGNGSAFPYDNVGSYRLLLQGFDIPFNTTISGFPLNESTVGAPPERGTEYGYFTRLAYRASNTIHAVPANAGEAITDNNYIWVSWDIVCDWYHKSRIYDGPITVASLFRADANGNAILCTYGAVTYRYLQNFYRGDGPNGGFQ